MAKFNFNLRDASAKEETAIHLVIRFNGERIVFHTGEVINPKFWESKKQRVKVTKQFPQNPEFNLRLDNIENKAKNLFRKFENEYKRSPTKKELTELLYQEFKGKHTAKSLELYEFIEKHLEELKLSQNDHTGRSVTLVTIRGYRQCLNLIKEFGEKSKAIFGYNDITLDFYYDFLNFLQKKGYSKNTVGKHIKSLRSFMNAATERGLNTNMAFKSKRFTALSEESDNIYLNEKELDELYKLDLKGNKRLERVRDLFLVGCHTGLRFSDFSNIKPSNIKKEDGLEFIEIITQKTANVVTIPVHRIVKKILNKYKGKYENSLPPALTNQKMNSYLKEIGRLMESLKVKTQKSITKGGLKISKNINKYELLSTHTARRSFATNNYKSGLNTRVIMSITGHKTEGAFLKYIKVTSTENAKLMKLHWDKQQKLKIV
jgi:integrase